MDKCEIKLIKKETNQYEYTFECDNQVFMGEFRMWINEFLSTHNGVIKKVEIDTGNPKATRREFL